MGDVVHLAAFRDRRKEQPQTPLALDNVYTKDELHYHLRSMHRYGGPKGQRRDVLDRIHDSRHADPYPNSTPHTHA